MFGRPGGGKGGASSTTSAITRLEVIDPHLVIMMRDVMDASDTAVRLKVAGGAGGGGGGGGRRHTSTPHAARHARGAARRAGVSIRKF